MHSWPPATMMSASPFAICCMPSATARRPEPQTWLRPQAVVSFGMPALHRRLAGRVLALARGQHLAEDDLVDLGPLDLGARERRLDRGGAEVVRRRVGEGAVEGPDRRARRADDDDFRHIYFSIH